LKKAAEMLNRPIQTAEKQLRKAIQLVQAHLNGSLLKEREVR
jgi:hypothetical protein